MIEAQTETLPGSTSVVFLQEAENLREYFKNVVKYGGVVAFRFHWGVKARMNIDPSPPLRPMEPALLCPAVAFVEAAAAACDARDYLQASSCSYHPCDA